jgi:hypothetical protein
MHRQVWRGALAVLALTAATVWSHEVRAAEQKAAGGLNAQERATLNRTWEVKEPGKRIDKLPFAESDFAEYGKRVLYKRALHGEKEDYDADICNEKNRPTGTVGFQVRPTPRDAQKLLAGLMVMAGKQHKLCAIAKADGNLRIGDACFFQWDGNPKDMSSEDSKHVRRLTFARNNVVVTIFVQKAATTADVVGFIKLAHALDAALVKALVEDKSQGAQVQSTDTKTEGPEGKKGAGGAKKAAMTPKSQ